MRVFFIFGAFEYGSGADPFIILPGPNQKRKVCDAVEGQRIVKRLMDDIGRIIIPADMREALDLIFVKGLAKNILNLGKKTTQSGCLLWAVRVYC